MLAPDDNSKQNGKNHDRIVMVIDDSKVIRVTAEKLLRDVGFNVILATDGFDALSKMIESRPDVIVLDVVMPEMDGYRTCELIKDNTDFKEIPIIMLSSKNGLFDRARGRLAGLDLYLTKPFSEQSLIEAVHNVIVTAQIASSSF